MDNLVLPPSAPEKLLVTEKGQSKSKGPVPSKKPTKTRKTARKDWFSIGDQTFQHTKLYQNPSWKNIDFKKFKIVGANFGGPVALVPIGQDPSDEFLQEENKTVFIFSASGNPLGEIQLNSPESIVGTGWNDHIQFVLITEEGIVSVFNVQGKLTKIWKTSWCQDGILSARVWGTGFVCLTRKLEFYATLNFENPFEIRLKKASLTAPPTAWTIIEPQLSDDGACKVLVCTSQGTVITVSEDSVVVGIQVGHGLFQHICVSPSGRLAALFTDKNVVWILTSDFLTEIVNFKARSPQKPSQMEWCGGDAVVVYWEVVSDHRLLMIGPDAEYHSLNYSKPIHLVPECDGIRIVGQIASDIITKVSSAQAYVYTEGAANAAFVLYQSSFEFYVEKEPTCDQLIRSFTPELLESAVNVLIEAAAYEFRDTKQRPLLTGAAFGMGILQQGPSTHFQKTCNTLRVLNTLRSPSVGIPLTIGQYQILTPHVVISHLLNLEMHHMASQLCTYLSIPCDRVLLHWAIKKVSTSKQTDVEILTHIIERTKEFPGLHFASVAWSAWQKKRYDLALSLLELECRADEQVPLLIKMEKYLLALQKSCQSGDTDLILLSLLVIHRLMDSPKFYTVLMQFPSALGTWRTYCSQSQLDELPLLDQATNSVYSIARNSISLALGTKDLDQRDERIKEASNAFKQVDSFAYQQTEDELGLLLIQRDLENALGTPFVGASLYTTLYQCIITGAERRSVQIRDEFKVSPKQWWFIKVKAYSAAGRWENLKQFSEEISPIGYKPFFEACYEYTNTFDAFYFANKIVDYTDKVKALVLLGKWKEAIKTVKTMKSDPEKLIKFMKANCTKPIWQQKIQKLEEKWAAGELKSMFSFLG